MNDQSKVKRALGGMASLLAAFSVAAAPTADNVAADAAQHASAVKAVKLAKSNRCLQCHSMVKRKKEGPSYPTIAARYKGDPDAENKLIYHITSGENIKRANGMEEHHKVIMTKNPEELRNLVKWILNE